MSGHHPRLAPLPGAQPGTLPSPSPSPSPAPALTLDRRLGAGPVLAQGRRRPYRQVQLLAGEPHLVRPDLLGPGLAGRVDLSRRRPIAALAHVTDLQLPDVQSTARFEFFNARLDDPRFAKLVPVQRPQEALTARAMQAMVGTLNRVNAAGTPLTGRPLDVVVTTGDAIDNAQWNELRNWLALMDGGLVRPGSGGPGYEGVQALTWPDDAFWRPAGHGPNGPDSWRREYGFGDHSGLLEQAMAAFGAQGLDVPWLACFGNHEALIQGVGVVTAEIAAALIGDRKPALIPGDLDADRALAMFTDSSHEFFGHSDLTVTADPARRPITRGEFVEAHFRAGARPYGHGFTRTNRQDGTAYYAHDLGPDQGSLRLIALDTTSVIGAADGCLHEDQVAWLTQRLVEVHSSYRGPAGEEISTGNQDRLVVLFSHHDLYSLTNIRHGRVGTDGLPVFGAPQLKALLHRFPNVVLWLNGHTHTNAVRAHPRPGVPGSGFWEVTTCAIMDWPCQARLLELIDEGDGTLSIVCTMLDHEGSVVPGAGPVYSPADLAGLHREIAGNVPWADFDSRTSGRPTDRNVLLPLKHPTSSKVRRDHE